MCAARIKGEAGMSQASIDIAEPDGKHVEASICTFFDFKAPGELISLANRFVRLTSTRWLIGWTALSLSVLHLFIDTVRFQSSGSTFLLSGLVSKVAAKNCLELNAATNTVEYGVTCTEDFADQESLSSGPHKAYFVATIIAPDVWYDSPEIIAQHLVNMSIESRFVVLSFEDSRCPKLKDLNMGPDVDSKTSLRQTCNREGCEYLPQSLISYKTASLKWWHVLLRSAGLQPILTGLRKTQGCRVSAKTVERAHWCGVSCDVGSLPTTYDMISPRSEGKYLKLHQGSFPSCALVLNSGILKAVLNPALGPLIDAHSHIIRVNNGPAGKNVLGDFTSVAGTKTSFRVAQAYEYAYEQMSGEIGLFNVYTNKEGFVNASSDPKYKMANKTYEIPESFRQALKVHHAFDEVHKPSTGLIALALALHMCQKVSVFGKSLTLNSVDMSSFDAHYWEHLFGNEYADIEKSSHSWSLEQKVYEQLERVGMITTIP